MAPFEPPISVLNGFKERIEAIAVQGDRVYLGTVTGNLHIYGASDSSDGHLELVEVKKGIARRAIEQLGYVKDINSLVVLSESQVTLYPLPNLTPPTPLTNAKAAFSFATHTAVVHLQPDGTVLEQSQLGFGKSTAVPTQVTYLVVGCRRKLVIYSWKDGEAQEAKEAVLPHSARAIVFLNHDVVCLAYPADYVMFSLATMSVTEISAPFLASSSAAGISNMGMGAFSGLGGYMTLGLGAKAKPCITAVKDSEILIAKDNVALFIGADGKQSREERIDWPASPEEISLVKPYVFSILPPGSVPSKDSSASPPSFIQSPVIQVHSSISLSTAISLPYPFEPTPSAAPGPPTKYSLRLLTPSPGSKSPLYVVSTPADRVTAGNEGSTLWSFRMKGWGEQIDELVAEDQYSEALALLDTLDPAVLPDKDRRINLIRALHAVHEFKLGHFDAAIDTFTELNINPAKVIALYPESVAGRLSVPQDQWISLFGGPAPKARKAESSSSDHGDSGNDSDQGNASSDRLHAGPSPPSDVVARRIKSSLDAIRLSGSRDPETSSISSNRRRERPSDNFSLSVEALLRYLPDRRQKVAGMLETFNITPSKSHRHAALSETSVDDIFAIPSAPVSALTPEQLIRYSQIVDTALFKSYLIIRPGLLGPLCRRPNWCEVSEVEEVLVGAEKYTELISLYNGKEMHAKALDLLRKLSEKQSDVRDKLGPSISYLQRLGPEHLDQTFNSSRWIFAEDPDMAFEIFTSEEVELPRQPVATFLESVDPKISARYLEYLIEERGEKSYQFHDRLAELYLRMTLDAKRRGHIDGLQTWYSKLLHFVDTTNYYQVDRLFGILPTDDLYEAKAILLGRLGRHDNTLELYAYRLRDYRKAEEYCQRIYQPGTDTECIFLTLLRIYLRPAIKTSDDLLTPALELISRHSPRLDAEEALQLLPPLVTAQDVRAFLLEAMRAPIFDTKVVRDISKARNEQAARKLMYLQSNRVKVTDTRICPQCHKRIGHSFIAVHSPGGEVTHYQCREPFSRKLKEMRHA